MFKTRKWEIFEKPFALFPVEKILFCGSTDDGKRFICLRFENFGVKPTKLIAQMCSTTGVHHLVLILDKPTRAPSQQLMTNKNITFESFLPHELLYNPMNHPLQPQYEPYDEKQKVAFFQHYGLKEESIPKMSTTDVVARYHYWIPGTLVKVISPSSVGFRLVHL